MTAPIEPGATAQAFDAPAATTVVSIRKRTELEIASEEDAYDSVWRLPDNGKDPHQLHAKPMKREARVSSKSVKKVIKKQLHQFMEENQETETTADAIVAALLDGGTVILGTSVSLFRGAFV